VDDPAFVKPADGDRETDGDVEERRHFPCASHQEGERHSARIVDEERGAAAALHQRPRPGRKAEVELCAQGIRALEPRQGGGGSRVGSGGHHQQRRPVIDDARDDELAVVP